MQNRLDVYEKQTKPLIDFYAEKGLLKNVDGPGASFLLQDKDDAGLTLPVVYKGAVPDTFLPLGRILPAPGCYSEVLHLFLARNLHMGEQHLDPGEFLNVERIPFDEMVHRCMSGEIEDAKTISAVLKAKILLNL